MGSWIADEDDIVARHCYPTKLGDNGFESERLWIETGECHSGEIVTFEISHQTWSGNTIGATTGYSIVVRAHTREGTAHQHWHSRSTGDAAGKMELLATIESAEDVDIWRGEVSRQMSREWRENRLRWANG